MSDNTILAAVAAVLVEQAIILIAAVATLRQGGRDDRRRLEGLEARQEEFPDKYIPRSELKEILKRIEETASHTHALLMALITAGGDRNIALKAIEAAAEVAGVDVLAWIEPYLQVQLPRFEGRCPFFYLDTDGHVTIGTGTMVPDAASALRLPLRDRLGNVASPQAVLADFTRVSKMPKGHLSTLYRCPASLTLTSEDTLELDRSRCLAFVAQLRAEFVGFDAFPASAKIGLLDMIYNLGLGHEPESGRRGEGLLDFTHLCADIRSRNWDSAAAHCARNTDDLAFNARNAWTRGQFLSAREPIR